MPEQKLVPFFEMFICCHEDKALEALLEGVQVITATVDKTSMTMRVTLLTEAPVPPVYLRMIEAGIAAEFGLAAVNAVPVTASQRRPESAGGAPQSGKAGKAQPGRMLLGRAVRGVIMPMEKVTLELGRVSVRGEVFAVSSRYIPRRKAWVLGFDMTDYTGSIHISKFIPEADGGGLVSKIQQGMHLTVSGRLSLDRFYNDLVLEPVSIAVTPEPERRDGAAEPRAELHLHTKMSALDSVCDTAAAVKRAISWGHPAIAITDHGVVHSFPEAHAAAGDKIKVIYGVEGYLVNDTDALPIVYGDVRGPLTQEIVVFDIETTGLNAMKDRLTEIGAVIMRGGVEVARFQTFADPGMKIPLSITELTGITDEDVRGAPGQEEAVRAFLDFAGGRPLAAHNASFDIGFIHEASLAYGIPYTPRYIDTLPLARALLPEMRSHKLNLVAAQLALPEFTHHRATDDAVTTGLVLTRFMDMLGGRGVTELGEIDGNVAQELARRLLKGRVRPKHVILLAKNQAGIRNLYKLVTKSHLEHFSRYPIMPKSLIEEHREGLLIGSACEAGEVFTLVSEGGSRLEQRRLAAFYDYLEIQPVCNNRFMLSEERPRASDEDGLRAFNERVVELGRELGKPVVATGDVHFLDPQDEIYRHVILAAKEFADADKSLPIYFKTTQEMLDEFSYLGEETAYEVVVTNTRRIAELCETVRPLPPAKKLFAPKIENSAGKLQALVYGRLRELYGDNPPELVKTRVETELRDILERHYDVIYVTAQLLVADSLRNGYLVGSRGSVGSSVVAYLSGITEVNALPAHYRCPACRASDFESGRGYGCGADMPDRLCPVCGAELLKDGFDIPFETFLGFGGDKVPDIDLNFSGEYQAAAHKYTTELFGAEHVFRAGTIGTIAEKTAYGYVRKYLERYGKTVPKAEENRLALGCVGVKRTTGQHPGGLVVIPQDMEITDFCPAQHPADDADGGIVTTHFEYHSMEDNLLKLDELGHDDPTMIRMLEDLTGISAQRIRLDDGETMAIFKSPAPLGLEAGDDIIGETGSIGIPEFGTGFTRQMLCDTRPEKFDTLVRLSGFSHGTDVWLGNAKDIILSGTAGISETIGCRDDIMLYLISLGMDEKLAFKIMESVRKGRGLPDGAEALMRDLGVPDWYIGSCKKIQYLFPKAHAVAYVMMAFRIAWFKVHEPLAFYSAYFYRRSQKDAFDAEYMTRGIDRARAKIREIRGSSEATVKEEELLTTLEACYEFYKRGFEFAPIDLYESDAVRFNIAGNTLRPPFVAVSGLGETAARDLAERRETSRFVSIEDVALACKKVSKTHIEQLKGLGAFRDLPDTSQLRMF